MLDFVEITDRQPKKGYYEIYPRFIINNESKDLMIKGSDFEAIWLEDKGLWSTREQDLINLIDNEMDKYYQENIKRFEGYMVNILYLRYADTKSINMLHNYCHDQSRDNYKPLNIKLLFSNSVSTKEDYATKKLDYPLEEGDCSNFLELLYSLYDESEATKILWAIGSVVSGDSKQNDKFLVLYGLPGTGKGTILTIIQDMFKGYTAVFDAKSLGSNNSEFALEVFKSNPLVAIQFDGDLSKIDNNARLNSLISHETMTVNEKHKSIYSTSFNSFLFMGTNKPVMITDNKSGIIRRLIDVNPKGITIPRARYKELMANIKSEYGAIAYHALQLYLANKDMYDDYHPINMMGETNDFYNFMSENYIVFSNDDHTTLKEAWEMYKVYVEDAHVFKPLSKMDFKNELKTYFRGFEERHRVDSDTQIRNYYFGFKNEVFNKYGKRKEPVVIVPSKDQQLLGTNSWLNFQEQSSVLDEYCKDCPAQYASSYETPSKPWAEINTTLSDVDTSQLHYLKVPDNLIVIDFDLKDEEGNKSFEKNLQAASMWPETYAELSKSGGGIHLHYLYDGDVSMLSREYADNIEIKVFTGKSSLRRKLTKCTANNIAVINGGLPIKKGGTKVINFDSFKDEEHLRNLIMKNLRKECHPATKPSMDFIYKLLEDAYNSGMKYDVSDMHKAVRQFAMNSSHQSDYCLSLLPKMHFKSDEDPEAQTDVRPIVFYDVEVFPNLFLVNWKFYGKNEPVHRMINPKPIEMEELFKYRLVGFNCRRYDNHILYARYIGYDNKALYELSQNIINKGTGFFGPAYNISYTDIYDYAKKKQSLKKWEVELGIKHLELGLPWDQPVPEELWDKVSEYCDNDVISTEAVWEHTKEDFLAREILADLADMTVNDTTNSLTTRMIFGKEKNPDLVYTNLEETFPGYKFVKEWNPETKKYDIHNMYRGTDLGFGGYVYAEPGMYRNVALLDVASMHPNSIIAMNVFGEYTENYEELVDARIFIKHKDFESAGKLFNGKLAKYLTDDSKSKALSNALKLPINAVYGLTSAKFSNPFRDPRNENNIVALRGALFMRTLQDEVVARGFKVIHIKTDSIKIPDATPEIIQFCMEFARRYGYEFEHEATYDRICLVNDAVYIAREKNPDGSLGEWTATGTQFQVPYVFKKCFTKEPIVFDDLCEVKEVQGTSMYLDKNEGVDNSDEQLLNKVLGLRNNIIHNNYVPTKSEQKKLDMYADVDTKDIEATLLSYHNMHFIGRVGLFCPVTPGCGGGILLREAKTTEGNIKYDSVNGTKGYRWLESQEVLDKNLTDCIDKSYYENLVNEAIETISQYGDYYWFAS